MKKLFFIICVLISFNYSFGQGYPVTQGLGGDSTLVLGRGGLKGRIILYGFTDTIQANTQRIKNYPYALIGTSGNKIWYRNSTATQWINFSSSSNSPPPSVVSIIDSFHFQICNINGCQTFTTNVIAQTIQVFNDNDTTTTVVVCSYGNNLCDTTIINSTPIVPPGKFVDSIYSKPAVKTDTLIYNNNGDSVHVKVYDRNCGLIDGGIVTYDSLLVFNISPAIYILCSDGVRRTSGQTPITLDAADGTFNRFDAIVLDSTGVNKVTGTSSSDPVQPQINPDQILLTFILVAAGDTTPTEVTNCTNPDITIYDENTGSPEWSHTSTVSANFNNTVTPFHLLKDIGVGTWTGGENIIFTTPTPVAVRSRSYLRFALRTEFNMQATNQFQVSWVTSQGTASVNVSDGVYGFGRNVTGSQQIITIPITDFTAPNVGTAFQLTVPSTVSLKITFNGKNTHGILIDYIQLGGACIVQPPPTPTGQRDNSFGIVNTVSGSATATIPTDILTVTGTGGTTVSATGKTLTINSTAVTAYTSDNGITRSTATNFQLGGIMTKHDTLNGKNLRTLFFDSLATFKVVTKSTVGGGYSFYVGTNLRFNLATSFSKLLSPDLGSYFHTQNGQAYISTNGDALIGSVTSHFYSDDSTIWSTTNRRGFMGVYKDTVKIYSDDAEFEMSHADGIEFEPPSGKFVIDSLAQGVSTDSVMVWNKTTGAVGYRNTSSFGGITTADNGVSASTATNVQFGATNTTDVPLLHHTYLNMGSNILTFKAPTTSGYLEHLTGDQTFAGDYSRLISSHAFFFDEHYDSTNNITTSILNTLGSGGQINLQAFSGIGASLIYVSATGGISISNSNGMVLILNLSSYADNAAALLGGLGVGNLYRNGDALQIVHVP